MDKTKLIPARKLAIGQQFKFSGKDGERFFQKHGYCFCKGHRSNGGIIYTVASDGHYEPWPTTGGKMVYPAEAMSAPTPVVFQVGDAVTVFGRPAVVTAVSPDGKTVMLSYGVGGIMSVSVDKIKK